jgi:hypothetical protein
MASSIFTKGLNMKSVAEFPNFKLLQGISTKTTLAAEGKTPEEIQAKLGETFKYEGDKLKYFVNAVEVAGQNLEKLSRVIVVSLNEGENVPTKATKVEEQYYIPEFISPPKGPAAVASKGGPGKGRQGGGKGGGKQKESPWGISPEEKAAKKASSLRAAALKNAKTTGK